MDPVLNQEQDLAMELPTEVRDVMREQSIIKHVIPLAAVNHFIFENIAKIIEQINCIDVIYSSHVYFTIFRTFIEAFFV